MKGGGSGQKLGLSQKISWFDNTEEEVVTIYEQFVTQSRTVNYWVCASPFDGIGNISHSDPQFL